MDAPTARSNCTLSSHDGRLYLFGGVGPEDRLYQDLFVFHAGTTSTIVLAVVWAYVRLIASLFADCFMIGLFLGWFESLDVQRWERIAAGGSVPSERHSCAAAVLHGSLYVYGGLNQRGPLNDLYRYDIGTPLSCVGGQ